MTDINEDVSGMVRRSAKLVTGGNCTYVDDDLALLTHLAVMAVKHGHIQHIHKDVAAKAVKACANIDEIEPRRSGNE